MTRYRIDDASSHLVVKARSSVHDTDTRFSGLAGHVEVDPEALGDGGEARAEITVDMRTADAGDWLKNRKLRKDMDFESHPEASFTLQGLSDVRREGDRFHARATGVLRWRGKSVEVSATGQGLVNAISIDARASFELDVTSLGVKPPKILMFKVEDVVTVEVRIVASAAG